MSDLKAQARALAETAEAKKKEAAAAYAEFDALRKSAAAEGVDFAKNADAFAKLDAASKAYDSLRDEASDIEAKRTRLLEMIASDGKPEERKAAAEVLAQTLGERFTKSDVYLELKASGAFERDADLINTRGVTMATGAEMKTLLSSTDVGTTTVTQNNLFRRDRLNLLVPSVQPALNLLDVIPTSTTVSDTIEWVVESSFTNNAAETAESTNATPSAAPESAIAFSTQNTPIREVTHFIPVTKKILQDADMLNSWIEQRLVYGIQKRLQSQLVNGDGTGQNLTGLLNVSNIRTQARGTDSRADAIHKALTQIRIYSETQGNPQFLAIHPTDWETLRLEKNTQGNYYYGDASSAGLFGGTVWGLTPIVTTAVTAGTPVIFDPNAMSLVYHNSGMSLSMSDSHSTYFTERKIAMLASVRAGLAVFQPAAIAKVTSF